MKQVGVFLNLLDYRLSIIILLYTYYFLYGGDFIEKEKGHN